MKIFLIAVMVIGLGLFGLVANTSASVNVEGLDDYVGSYTFKEGSPVPSVVIKVVKDKLVAASPDGNEYDLEKDKEKADTFNISDLGAVVIFTRNADKKVSGMKVNIQGEDIVADKDKDKETKKP